MSNSLRNDIKAYLIRMDLQAEEDLQAAEVAYKFEPCPFTAARLLGAQQHQQAVRKMLADLWSLLDNRL